MKKTINNIKIGKSKAISEELNATDYCYGALFKDLKNIAIYFKMSS